MKKRNSSIECLRILGMFFIVLGHFTLQTHWNFNSSTSVFLKSSIEALWIGGKLGVDIFVLISGYFLVRSKFNWKSFFNVWTMSYFYSMFIYILSLIFKINTFNLKDFIKAALLVSTGALNWFVTAYLIMYLFSPFMNIVFRNISKNQFRYLLILILIIFSLTTTLFKNPSVGTTGNDSIWVMVVYSFGAYIGLYEKDLKKIVRKKYIITLLMSLILSIVSVFFINILSVHIILFNHSKSYLYFIDGTSPLQLLSAICLFMIFLSRKSYTNYLLNKIASTSFAVYLIHANLLIVNWLWKDVIDGGKYSNSYFAIFYGVFISILIYIICSFVELARQVVFGKLHFKIVTFLSEVMERLLDKFNVKF